MIWLSFLFSFNLPVILLNELGGKKDLFSIVSKASFFLIIDIKQFLLGSSFFLSPFLQSPTPFFQGGFNFLYEYIINGNGIFP